MKVLHPLCTARSSLWKVNPALLAKVPALTSAFAYLIGNVMMIIIDSDEFIREPGISGTSDRQFSMMLLQNRY